MMGCAGEASGMSLYEYEQRLWHWNAAHETEGANLPDIDVTMALIDKINADPRLVN